MRGSAPGPAPRRGVRHTIATVTQARRYAQVGWSEAWIARELGVSKATVARWVRPDRHARWLADLERHGALRAAERGSTGLGRGDERPEFKFARMQMLAELGLSMNAIATVMSFDFGDSLSAGQVRYALEAGRYPPGAVGRAGESR